MTVKEILKAAAVELGMADEIDGYLNGVDASGNKVVADLLRCFNLVENELAIDYLPLYAEEEVETDTGAVFFAFLSKPVVRVIRVCDEWGNDAPFRLFPEYIKTQAGKIVVRYTYTPEEKGLEDDCDFPAYASLRLFAYGIASEYSLASGLFEESAVWDKKYKDAIQATYRSSTCRRIRSRRWV